MVEVACLCGSTRFRKEMDEWNRRLTLAGHIVLAPGVWVHESDDITEWDKERLDALHLAKINLADYVLVVNRDGYIGNSTRAEIEYADSIGKPVKFAEGSGEAAQTIRRALGSSEER